MSESEHELSELLGVEVVLDCNGPFVYVGVLERVGQDFLVLAEADAHDLRDNPKTRELYVLDGREHGIHPNRRFVWVRMAEVVGISRLEDVVPPR